MFNVNKMQLVAGDRQESQILLLEVEAFGENDLRAAAANDYCFFLNQENRGATVRMYDWWQPIP